MIRVPVDEKVDEMMLERSLQARELEALTNGFWFASLFEGQEEKAARLDQVTASFRAP
jgi:hypothetical protein